jgi:multimeric flavodoxin WrbA
VDKSITPAMANAREAHVSNENESHNPSKERVGMSKVKILGISGTQRKGGNCDQCLTEALGASASVSEVETEFVNLSGLHINHCTGCYRCHFQGTKERPCPEYDDDMTPLYSKIADSDGFILASPVYFGSVSSTMKVFMDRTLPFTTPYYYPDGTSEFRKVLSLRPAAAIAVGGARNDGIETTLYTFYRFFLYHDMIAVGAQIVGNAYATSFGGAVLSDGKPNAVNRDSVGMGTVHAVGKKVAVLAKTLKATRSTIESHS